MFKNLTYGGLSKKIAFLLAILYFLVSGFLYPAQTIGATQAGVDKHSFINNGLPFASQKQASTKSMDITIKFSAILVSNNHVGNEWDYWMVINGQQYEPGQLIKLKVTSSDIILIKTYAQENDKYPDTGANTLKIPVSQLKTGKNNFSVDVTVTENRGRYSGSTAKWRFSVEVVK